MGIEPIERLGRLVEERWSATNYDPQSFSDIATDALSQARLPEQITSDAIIEWALQAPVLPTQRDMEAKFGQPPVTLFLSRRFYIEALHWIDGSTTIHEHAFSGGFQVLLGSSIETRYRFEVQRVVDGHFVLGALRVAGTAVHNAGDVTPIRSGHGGLIHALFHLERPSVTIVVRTFRDPDAGPQFNYLSGGIGVDPFFVEQTRDRMLQLVSLLRNLEHPGLERMVGDLIARSDLHTAYRIVETCGSLPDRALLDRLIDRVRERDVAERFRKALDDGRRVGFLYGKRALIRDPELRFFLGVLLNATTCADVLALVRARVSEEDPVRKTASWVRQLSTLNVKIQAAGIPWQPNLLGLPEFTDDLEAVLAAYLAGRAPAPADVGAIKFLAHLRDLPALVPLFAGPP